MVRIKFSFKEEPKSYSQKKKNIELPNLVQIYWDITYKCPCICEHCYAKPKRILDEELSTNEIKTIINYLSDHNIHLVTFTGGEPFEREDIFEILRYAHEKNIHTSLITTGLYPKKIKQLKNLGVSRIQFSLDNSTPKIYDSLRGIPGLFEKLMMSIEASLDSNIRTSLCSTITKLNYDDIGNLFTKALDLNVDEFRLMRLMPCGISIDSYKKISITFEEYQRLLDQLFHRYINLENPILIDVEEPYELIKNFIGTPIENYLYYRGCLQGEAVCGLTADGKVVPCPIGNFEHFVCGDIRKDDLLYIWNNALAFEPFRNYQMIEICKECEYGNICKGGCRCAAFGYYGKMNAPDPMCPKAIQYRV